MLVDPTIRVNAQFAAIANAPATVLNPADQKTQKVSKGFFSSLASYIGKLLVAVTFPVSIPLLFLISKIYNALSPSKPSVTTTELPLTQRNNDLAIQTLNPRVNSANDNAEAAPEPLAIEAAPAPAAEEVVAEEVVAEEVVAEEDGINSLISPLKILAGFFGASLVVMNVVSAVMTASPLVSNVSNSLNSTLFTKPHHLGQTSFN